MSEYSICPGGSLKLKGGVAEGGIVKKWVIHSWSVQLCINKYARKKKKGKRKKEIFTGDDPVEAPSSLFQGEGDEGHVPSSGRNSPSVSSGSSRKTEAEKRFQEAQKRRVRTTISYSLNTYCFAL